jgi:hypothetical protein
MMGAGEGMAKGGGNSNIAGLGAQAAIGVGMAHMMNPAHQQPGPQFVPAHMQQQQPYAPQPGYPQAPGGAPQGGAPQGGGAPPAAAGPSIEARLERLADLKNKGLISDEEFQSRRSKILEEI